jgi:hypothetical protein
MEANAYSQYALKDLHQSIDLIDRQMTHCRTLENFDSQESRESTLKKLSTKRATLVKAALALTDLGVKYDPRFLPRSFIHPVEGAGTSVPPETKENSGVARAGRKRR